MLDVELHAKFIAFVSKKNIGAPINGVYSAGRSHYMRYLSFLFGDASVAQ